MVLIKEVFTAARKRGKKSKNKAVTKTVVVQSVAATPKNNKPKNNQLMRMSQNVRPNTQQRTAFRSYVNTLKNPFENAPVKLGWGCSVNTQLVTAYLRTPVTFTATGIIGVQMFPCLGSGAANTWSWSTASGLSIFNTAELGLNPANQAAIANTYRELRVVSGGIRIKPLAPRTAAEPVCYLGSTNGGPLSDVTGSTMDALMSSMNTDVLLGDVRSGVQVTVRPIDPESFVFNQSVVSVSTGALVTHPYALVTGNTGEKCFVECVLHFEALNKQDQAMIGLPSFELPNYLDTLTSVFNNVESMVQAANLAAGPLISAVKIGAAVASKMRGYDKVNAGGGYYMV
jgi:hypothetical protein